MSRARRFLDRVTPITPRAPAVEMATGDRFLVLLEGTETERRYLDDLCGKLGLTADNVVIATPGTDPVTLVQEAIARRALRKVEADKQLDVEYDQVWVVCDRERQHDDRFPRLRQACALAADAGIFIALSTPSFEYWLLLHWRYHNGVLADCAAVENLLSQEQTEANLPPYNKATYPLDVYVTPERVANACARARLVRQYHSEADPANPARYWAFEYVSRYLGANQPDGNPCTDVDQLVRQLNHAANYRRRFVHYPHLPVVPFTDR